MRVCVLICIILSSRFVLSQNPVIDSLKNGLSRNLNDSTRLALFDRIIENTSDVQLIAQYSKQMDSLIRMHIDTESTPLQLPETKVYWHYFAIVQNNLAFLEESQGSAAGARNLYKQALKIFEDIGEREGEAMVLNNLGYLSKTQGRLVEAFDYYNRCIVARNEIGDNRGLAIAQNNLGLVYLTTGNTTKALKYFREALLNNQKAGSSAGEFTSLNNLSGVYYQLGEYDIYLSYSKQAFACAEKSSRPEVIARALDRVGQAYRLTKNYPAALENYTKALTVARKNNLKKQEGLALEGIGLVHEATGELDKALAYVLEALKIRETLINKMDIARASESAAAIYEKKGSAIEARNYFLKALRLSQAAHDLRGIELSASGLFRVYKRGGNAGKALEMYELYTWAKDSLRNDNARNEALKSQYKFEFQLVARQDSIKSVNDSILHLQEKRLLAAQLAQEKSQRFAWALIGLLIIGFAAFVFYRYRLRQRLREMKLRNRIASDLHDEVGSSITSISMFAGMARTKPVEEISSIVGEIENTSRQTLDSMADIVWSIEPANDNFGVALQRMERFGMNILAAAGIEFAFDVANGVDKAPVNMVERKNIYLIFKEAVNNAAKYSQAKQVTISINKLNKGLVMEVSDDGKGFDLSATRTGNGMRNMKRRADEISASLKVITHNGQGTKIRLELSKKP